MNAVYDSLIPALWFSWLAYWGIAARGVKSAARIESVASRMAHVVPLVIAGVLTGISQFPGGWLTVRFIPLEWGLTCHWLGAAMVAAGLAFSVWARVHIGRNWSGMVTVKAEHELIRSGPYGWVRHPIYSGLLIAFVGSAIARGEWRGVIAVALVFVAFWRKLRVEERWMTEVFGDSYLRYREQVRALIPCLL
jgi:protein-S-isoprenylcysteine O-methyltransferase Ste14